MFVYPEEILISRLFLNMYLTVSCEVDSFATGEYP